MTNPKIKGYHKNVILYNVMNIAEYADDEDDEEDNDDE